jgi:multisubunit Na+/H+ antiporter MnhB subunit
VNSVHRHSTRALALMMCGLGVAMIVATVTRGGGALALGVILGVAFVALGAARLYLAGDR